MAFRFQHRLSLGNATRLQRGQARGEYVESGWPGDVKQPRQRIDSDPARAVVPFRPSAPALAQVVLELVFDSCAMLVRWLAGWRRGAARRSPSASAARATR